MKIAEKKHLGRILALAIGMMLSVVFFADAPAVFVHASEKVENPATDEREITTWDCIWFGHYPQSTDGQGNFVNEPIKWRVLSVNESDAFLMSDQILDSVPFNEDRGIEYDYCLWEKSTIRSWLNGYDASYNKNGADYTENNFIDRAFDEAEQNAILVTTVINDKEIEYPHVPEDRIRENTVDRVYLADISEVTDPIYGFTAGEDATFTRVAVNTAYAAAGGSSGSIRMKGAGEKNSWILRSPGEYSYYCDFLCADGSYDDYLVDGNLISSDDHGVRPVLHLDLSRTDVWEYAGQAKSLKDQKITVNSSYAKIFGDNAFNLNAKASGDGKLSYCTSDENVVKVDSEGNVSIVGVGVAKITVTASVTEEYLEAERTVTITVKKKSPILEVSNYTKSYGDRSFTLKTKTDSDGKLSYHSSDPAIVEVFSSGKVTIKKAGTACITVKTDATDNCNAAVAEAVISVKKAVQTISAKNFTKTYGNKVFSLGAKTSGNGTLTYKSSNTKVATVDKKGKVILKGPGAVRITVTAAATTNYLKASKTVTLKVLPKTVTVKSLTSSKARTAVVTWKKDSTVTGYKIEYSTSRKFTGAKKVTVSKAAAVKTTISKLTSGKTYYVRIRAYKKSGSATIYGAYSSVKQVKVK